MKAKRLLITKILLAVAMCLAIVFAFVPWSAQSAYAATPISAASFIVDTDNPQNDYVTYSGGIVWGSGRIKFSKNASDNQSISFTTGIKYNLVISINSNSNTKVDAVVTDSNGSEVARRTSPAKGNTAATDPVLLDAGTYYIKSSLSAELRITELAFTKASVDVTGVTLDRENMTLALGETGTLTATVSPENATDKNVTWTSDNETVATVDGGTVTPVAVGKATITATAGGKSDTCVIEVTATKNCEVYFMVDGEQHAYEAVTPGTPVTITVEDPVKAGYIFKGWYNGETKYEFTDNISTDLTLVAKFEKDASQWITVTFMNEGAQYGEVQEILKGTAVGLPETPVKAGYNFDGWLNGETIYKEGDLVDESITLTAKWTEIPKDFGTYELVIGSSFEASTLKHNNEVITNSGMFTATAPYQNHKGTDSLKIESNYLYINLTVDAGKIITVVATASTKNTDGLEINNNMTNYLFRTGNGTRGVTDVFEELAPYTFTTTKAGQVQISLTKNGGTNNVSKVSVTIADPVKDVEVKGYTATLSDNIGFNFFVALNNSVSATKVEATCAGETLQMDMPAAEADGTYKITVNVVARLMADDITIQLYNETAKVGDPITYSVKAYAEKLLADQEQVACHELVKAMLNYGAAVQTKLNHNTANLANAGLEEAEKVSADIEDSYKLTANQVNLPATVTAKSVNVYFLTTTTLVVKFGADASVKFTCEGKNVKQSTDANGVTTVEISGITAKEISTNLTINVVDGENTGSVAISVSNYCYTAQTAGSASMQAAAKAMHAYGLAAANYKG